MIPVFLTVPNQVVIQTDLHNDQVADLHPPDLFNATKTTEDRVLTQDLSMLFVVIEFCIDKLILQVVFDCIIVSLKCLFKAVGNKQRGMSSHIVVVCSFFIRDQNLQLLRAQGIPQKRKLFPDPKGRDRA